MPEHGFPFPLSWVGDAMARSLIGRFEAGEGAGSGPEAGSETGGSSVSLLTIVGSSACNRISSSTLSLEKFIAHVSKHKIALVCQGAFQNIESCSRREVHVRSLGGSCGGYTGEERREIGRVR